MRKPSHVDVERLISFGHYIADCLPKYVQQVQLTAGDELELHIAPDGIIPTFTFLKDHHNTQFVNLSDITALDVPSREYRFEVDVILRRGVRVVELFFLYDAQCAQIESVKFHTDIAHVMFIVTDRLQSAVVAI